MKALQVIALVLVSLASIVFLAERATGWVAAYRLSVELDAQRKERALVILAEETAKIWSERSTACRIRYGGAIAADPERNQCCRANPPPGMTPCADKVW